jgi:hypothetical protein
VKEDSERQRRLLESEIIEILFPLIIYSTSSNVKRCISRFIRVLFLNERNQKDFICKWKICEYFKPLLTLLYKKVNIVVKESYSQLDDDNNKIKMNYIYDCQNDECRVDLFDFTKHIESVNIIFKWYEIEKSSFPWRYTSLCCSYSSLEILSDFVFCLWNLIDFKRSSEILDKSMEKFVYFQFVDLVKEITNSFDILQKMLEIPKIIFIMRKFGK